MSAFVANPTSELESKWVVTEERDNDFQGDSVVTGSLTGGDVVIGHLGRKTTVISDTVTKTLPTSAVTLLAAPAANIVSYLAYAIIRQKYTGSYTNIDAAGALRIKRGSDVISNSILNNAGASITSLTTLLTGSKTGLFLPLTNPSTTLGNLPPIFTYAAAEALTLDLSNGASGNLTGGNGSNELIVVLYYYQFDFTGL